MGTDPGEGLGSTATPFVSFAGVQKSYDGETLVVKGLDLDIAEGEFITMLGPSGSGKTTCLMMLAGFESVTNGEIRLRGEVINLIPPHRRGIGMVFQDYALFPHMTVFQNLSFPLEVRGVRVADRKRKVTAALEMVEMAEFARRRPGHLSGGQRQRVALARSLVFEPQLVLMDEPLGALDKNLRESMQYEISRLHRKLGITVVYVTHDQGEALTMSDRIAVFNEGHIQQCATPTELYEQPANSFVANFIGETNTFTGKVTRREGTAVEVEADGLTLGAVAADCCGGPGSATTLAVRPERVSLGDELENRTEGVVEELVYLGEQIRCRLKVGDNNEFIVKLPNIAGRLPLRQGDRTPLSWRVADCHALDS